MDRRTMNAPFGLGAGDVVAAPETSAPRDDPSDSLVMQLASLYQEKQELQSVLGVSTSSEIISLLGPKRNKEMVDSLTDQLGTLYGERQELETGLGCSDATQIIGLVSELRSSIRSLVDDSRRRLTYEASLLESHERYLA
jgi:hypothetical protein